MGDIARTVADDVALAVHAVGSAPIERVDIFDGPDLIETIRPYTSRTSAAEFDSSMRGPNIGGVPARQSGMGRSNSQATPSARAG